jgi:hypothetical protein
MIYENAKELSEGARCRKLVENTTFPDTYYFRKEETYRANNNKPFQKEREEKKTSAFLEVFFF